MASSARIDELRKKFEENPRRYFAPLANEYRKAGQIDQAIAICREYLPQQPGHMSGHIVYGQALYEARQFEESKVVFETALSLDPENLIALRHLGDIALLIGDSDGARAWYRRVLEADPRNEEIQAQLLTLDQAAAATPPAGDTAVSGAGQPTPSSAPTVVVEAKRASGATRTPPGDSSEPPRQPWARKTPAAGSRLTPTPKTLEVVVPAGAQAPQTPSATGSTPTPAASVPATIELESPFADPNRSSTSAPVDTGNLAGLETTSLATDSAATEPPPTAAGAEPAKTSADSPTPASGTESPLPRLSLVDLRAVTESFPEAPDPSPTVPEPAPSSHQSGPFVTETMAELYLKQGHREEALRVYRALLEQRPGDSALEARVALLSAELTARSAAAAAAPATSSGPAVPTAREAGAPTIRDLLAIVALRRPGFRPERSWGSSNGDPSASRSSEPGRDTSPRVPEQSRGKTAPAPRTDGIAGLFANAQISAADEGAALALALAFTEVNGRTPPGGSMAIEGTPAHRASNELSLDTVFGGGAGAPSNVSYDQFFSTGASTAQASGTNTGVSAADDVAHFTKWLEGLKRR
jgi:tetratricopeptide (TPR) repeat protein